MLFRSAGMVVPVIASDMDGTLAGREAWRGVQAWLVDRRPSFAVRRFVWVRLPLVLAFRLGLIPKEPFRARWLADQAGLFRGVTAAELDAMGEWVVEHHLWPARRQAVIERLDAELPPAEIAMVDARDLPASVARPFTETDGTRGRLLFVEHADGADTWDGRYMIRWAGEIGRAHV